MVNWLPQETGIDGIDGMIMRDYPLGDERKIFYRARREHD